MGVSSSSARRAPAPRTIRPRRHGNVPPRGDQMRHRITGALSAGAAAVAVAAFWLMAMPAAGQAPATYKAPRSAFKDGKPDLNGIWQANNTANWDLQDHAARQGPLIELGAAFSIPAG